MKLVIVVLDWNNQVGYSDGDEVSVHLDRPSAVAKIRETVTDCGLDHGQQFDDDPNTDDQGSLFVPHEGFVNYRIFETGLDVPLPQRMLAAADTVEEVSRVYDYMTPSAAEWSAARLRHEAQHVEADTTAVASEPQPELLTVGAYVRMFVETDCPIPASFDATDHQAVEDLWYEHHDYNGDGTEILEITIDHDKVEALHEFDRDV